MATAERNWLSEDIIQACECLEAWWDSGLMAPWNGGEEEEEEEEEGGGGGGGGGLLRASYKCISIETNSRQSLSQ